MNHYEPEDHAKVSEKIQKIKNAKWIVSYDNVPQIRKLYAKSKSKKYFLTHTAYEIRIGKEIAFHSKGLIVPRIVL
jgi:DNA adenine methylase